MAPWSYSIHDVMFSFYFLIIYSIVIHKNTI